MDPLHALLLKLRAMRPVELDSAKVLVSRVLSAWAKGATFLKVTPAARLFQKQIQDFDTG